MLEAHRARKTWSTRIDAYIALSQFMKKKFVDCGVPANKIYVKPNFVEPDPGEPSSPGEYALFVGRLAAEKGVWTLLKAWQLLQTPVPLVIAGDGAMRGALETEVAKHQLRRVRFTGQLKRDDVYELIKKAAFVVVPSVWDEPFGLIIAEAFACGTPVLGASVGAIPEMLQNRVTGLQFAPRDPEALAMAVEWAWNHRPQLERMGKAARRFYEDRYTGETNYQLLMEIYACAIDAHFRFKKKHRLRAAA